MWPRVKLHGYVGRSSNFNANVDRLFTDARSDTRAHCDASGRSLIFTCLANVLAR